MTALRLPVEAERVPLTIDRNAYWIVRDGHLNHAEDESLTVAFDRLAWQQFTRPRISWGNVWASRIAQEKARWMDARDEVGFTWEQRAEWDRRNGFAAQDHALDVASAEAVRTYVPEWAR